jgi:hypothetical protein
MTERIERFIAMAFEDWKKNQPSMSGHPSEEEIACFLEGKLNKKDAHVLKEHLACCDACVSLIAADLHAYPVEELDVPPELLARARAMVSGSTGVDLLEIVLQTLKQGFEIVKTTGDVLFGQEYVAASVLRSRNIGEFRDEVVVVKDFADSRIEAKIQAQDHKGFRLSVFAKDKRTQKPLSDLRITLSRDDIELESRITEKGEAVFDSIAPGRYSVKISGLKTTVAQLVVEVRQ